MIPVLFESNRGFNCFEECYRSCFHSTSMAHPLATIMLAIGHRASVCSLRISSSLGSRIIGASASSSPVAGTTETLMVPVMRCSREGTLGVRQMGSSRAPASSRKARILSNCSKTSVLDGRRLRGRPEDSSAFDILWVWARSRSS